MLPAHLSTQLNTGRGIGTATCEADDVFPPHDLWFGLDTNSNFAAMYSLYLDVEMLGYVIFIFIFW